MGKDLGRLRFGVERWSVRGFASSYKFYRNVMSEERRELIARVDRNGASTLAVAVMGGNIRAALNRIAGRGAWTLRPSPKPRPALLPELSFT